MENTLNNGREYSQGLIVRTMDGIEMQREEFGEPEITDDELLQQAIWQLDSCTVVEIDEWEETVKAGEVIHFT